METARERLQRRNGWSASELHLYFSPSFENDYSCPVCGRGFDHDRERHHVVYRSRGGRDGATVTLCHECHQKHHSTGFPRFWFRDDWWWWKVERGNWIPFRDDEGNYPVRIVYRRNQWDGGVVF